MGDPFPQNCRFSWVDLDPHLVHDTLDHSEIIIQTAWRLVQLFSHRWPHSVPILYCGRPFPPKLPLPMGGSGPHLTHFLGPIRAHNPNGISVGSAVFAQMTAECPYTLQWEYGTPLSPLKIAPSHGYLDPHLIYGFLVPPKSSTQMASRSVQPFLQGSLVWQTNRQTDRSRYSVGNNRPHLRTYYCDAA